MRSRPGSRRCPRSSGTTSASTATTSPRRVRPRPRALRARPPRLRRVLQGQADHDDELRLVGRPSRRGVRRHAIHPPGDLPLVADELPLRQRPNGPAARPGGAFRRSRRSPTGQPDRAAGDGRGHARRHLLAAAAGGSGPRRAGRRDRHVRLHDVRTISAHPGRRERRDATGRDASRSRPVHGTHGDPGVYCAHPLGGARMAESPDLGVVDDHGAVTATRACTACTASTAQSSRPRSGSTHRSRSQRSASAAPRGSSPAARTSACRRARRRCGRTCRPSMSATESSLWRADDAVRGSHVALAGVATDL